MTKIVNRIRNAVAKARASQPFGAWIPSNKVIAATLSGGLVAVARAIDLVDLPVGWSEVVAVTVIGYLFPESPVVAAHVVRAETQKAELTERVPPGYSSTTDVLARPYLKGTGGER